MAPKVSHTYHFKSCSVPRRTRLTPEEIQRYKGYISRAAKKTGLTGITRTQLRKDEKIQGYPVEYLGICLYELVSKGKLMNASGKFVSTSLAPLVPRVTDWTAVMLFVEAAEKSGKNYKQLKRRFRRSMGENKLKQMLLFLMRSKILVQQQSPVFLHHLHKKEEQ
ncbi:hypothetical protein AVEN_146078-1 [Araneus ventricosus]|uniref:Uncharacterized protein n=1 Tax=Araneus ventricosus TaxID=182803 RepID=A0A4Y2U8G0_ARAVE|nr:hypothetical protein AVEN_146078-1 [Araneus ventricosus]